MGRSEGWEGVRVALGGGEGERREGVRVALGGGEGERREGGSESCIGRG